MAGMYVSLLAVIMENTFLWSLLETGCQNEMHFPSCVIHYAFENTVEVFASWLVTCELTADVWHVVCAGVSLLVSHGAIAEDTSWEMYMLIDQGESRWNKISFCHSLYFCLSFLFFNYESIRLASLFFFTSCTLSHWFLCMFTVILKSGLYQKTQFC